MKVQGRDCTLTVAKDDNYYPLPYSEETVRQTSKGYLLPCVICKRNRDNTIVIEKKDWSFLRHDLSTVTRKSILTLTLKKLLILFHHYFFYKISIAQTMKVTDTFTHKHVCVWFIKKLHSFFFINICLFLPEEKLCVRISSVKVLHLLSC